MDNKKENNIIREITPLSDKDCFYIADRYKTEFTYPIHCHKEYELNFIEHGSGLSRIVGDSKESVGEYDLVLITSPDLEHVWEQGECKSDSIHEITVQFTPAFLSGLINKNQFERVEKMLGKARNGLCFPMPAILKVYEEQGIRDGAPQNQMKGPAFETELAKAYPECRLVVTKETLTVEGMIKIVYDLLKDKLNIAKITFTSGVNAASEEYTTKNNIDRCPLCGIALNENGVCPKCGYKKA